MAEPHCEREKTQKMSAAREALRTFGVRYACAGIAYGIARGAFRCHGAKSEVAGAGDKTRPLTFVETGAVMAINAVMGSVYLPVLVACDLHRAELHLRGHAAPAKPIWSVLDLVF